MQVEDGALGVGAAFFLDQRADDGAFPVVGHLDGAVAVALAQDVGLVLGAEGQEAAREEDQ